MRVVLLLIFNIFTVFADESFNSLLKQYQVKSDLSNQTKIENSGQVIVFTRKDIENMQARNLRDILKTLPLAYYNESRYGLPDSMYKGLTVPFNSNNFRIYIDNQEITTASYGSGIVFMGDINLEFVDHIEVYLVNPSFEFSTEPSRYVLKLYSKIAYRDSGNKLMMSYGIRGFNQLSFYNSDELDKFSYFAYFSRLDDKRDKIENGDSMLSRNQTRYQSFISLYNDKHKLQIQAVTANRDMFLGASLDGTPEDSYADYNYYHIGYENKLFNIVYETGDIYSFLSDDNNFYCIDRTTCYNKMQYKVKENIFTLEAKYKFDLDKNDILVGVKYRNKQFKDDIWKLNDIDMPKSLYDTQDIYTLFYEHNYYQKENSIFNLGVQYSNIKNNADVKDDTIFLARVGNTYNIDNQFFFKTFFYRTSYVIEPYIYNSMYKSSNGLSPEILTSFIENIKYKNSNKSMDFVVGFVKIDNLFIQNANSDIVNSEDSYDNLFAYFEYRYDFNLRNFITFRVSKSRVFEVRDENMDMESLYLRSSNEINKIQIFNEFNIKKNTMVSNKFYVDYSAGIKYRYSKSLYFSIKGENILNNAYETSYIALNPQTYQFLPPVSATPIDRKAYVSVEYMF